MEGIQAQPAAFAVDLAARMAPGDAKASAGGSAQDTFRARGQGISAGTELLPEAQQATAVSLNTAQNLSGPRPWSSEWVFEGRAKPPGLRPEALMTPQATLFDPATNGRKANGGDFRATGDASLAIPPELLRQLLEGSETAPVAANAPRSPDAAEAVRGGAVNAELAALEAQIQGLGGAIENVEGFDDPSGRPPIPGTGAGRAAGASRARASTGGEDFLSLHALGRPDAAKAVAGAGMGAPVFERGRDNPAFGDETFRGPKANLAKSGDLNGAAFLPPRSEWLSPAQLGSRVPRAELTGQVIPGSMLRSRLSTDAVVGLAGQIGSVPKGERGEIRIRLAPEELGEVKIRVSTHGNQVGLQIQASDEGARRILEESLSSLKDRLASQNLHMGKVEIAVASSSSSHAGDFGAQSQQHSQSGNSNPWEQAWRQGADAQAQAEGGSRRFAGSASAEDEVLPRRRTGTAGLVGASSSYGGRAAADARLDVMA